MESTNPTTRAQLTKVRRVVPIIAGLFLAIIIMGLPPVGTDLGVNGDISLAQVLNYAHQHDFQFGPDLLYTYGPLGFLVIFYYTPHLALLRLVVDFGLSCCVATGFCLLAWRLRPLLRLFLIAWFAFTAANLEPRMDLVFETGFFCWGFLSFLNQATNRLTCLSTIAFALLAAFLGLAKTSFLFLGLASVFLLFIHLLLHRKVRAALVFCFSYLAGLVVFWECSGQHLANFPLFLIRSFYLVQAYNQTLAWEGLPIVRHTGFLLVASVALVLLLRFFHSHQSSADSMSVARANRLATRCAKWVVTAWLCGILFTFWKHSFLREDFRHPAFLIAVAPMLTLSLQALPSPAQSAKFSWLQRAAVLLVCLISFWALERFYFPSIPAAVGNPFRLAWQHTKALVNPIGYNETMLRAYEAVAGDAALPETKRLVGNASIDSFGMYQSYLLDNNLNYHPAPIFQNYVASGERLTRINEQYYLSPSPPEFVLFTLSPIDRRFPTLEDPYTLRALLLNYDLAGSEKFFLVLKRKSTAQVKPQLTLLQEGTVRLGEPIRLPETNSPLWLEIQLQPSWLERFREFLFRAPTFRIAAWKDTPDRALLLRRRASASSLDCGFLASPLLDNTAAVAGFFTNRNAILPRAYTIEIPPDDRNNWKSTARFRISQLQSP